MSSTNISPVVARLDEHVRNWMAAENIPSIVLAITDREQTLHVGTYGYADVAARKPATAETLYETGSIGKSFTALALLQLKDEGRVDLHAPVTDYLPWFSVQSDFEPITLHHLLTHTSGIISGTDFAPDPRFEVWALRDTFTSHPPGEHFRYSNVGYKTLGLVLEQIEGKPYAEIISERVLDPLGLDDTYATVTTSIRPRMAVGYARLYDDRPGHRTDPLVPATWFQTNTGDGCLASPVTDLAAYLRLYLNRGAVANHQVLTEDNFDLMIQPASGRPERGESTGYGYGIESNRTDDACIIGHSGGMVGYFADMRGDLESGLGIVALVNGIGFPEHITEFGLKLLTAWAAGQDLPEVPATVDPAHIPNGKDFAGQYQSDTATIEIIAADNRMFLRAGEFELPLERRGEDSFFIPHPDLRRSLLSFGRDEHGAVVEAFHGNAWYRHERYSGPLSFDYPEEWNAFAGEYRSHNPWRPHVRVLLRKGSLRLERPDQPLDPRADGSFSLGDNPGVLRFDTIVDGTALHLNLSGNDYYRFFVPKD